MGIEVGQVGLLGREMLKLSTAEGESRALGQHVRGAPKEEREAGCSFAIHPQRPRGCQNVRECDLQGEGNAPQTDRQL